MKKFLGLILAAFILASTSSVYGIISLPPSQPGIEPPGPIISDDRPWNLKAYDECVGWCYRTYQERLESRCTEEGHLGRFAHTDARCRAHLQDSLQQCYAACKQAYMDPPPVLELPNGNSPGQGN